MPKISLETITIFNKPHRYELWYDTKGKCFYANKLPKEFEEFLEETKTRRPEHAEQVKLTQDILPALIKVWETASVKERIIIAYKAKWGSRNVRAFDAGNERWGSGKGGYLDEAKIEFEFEVYKEREVNGVKKYYKRERDWNHPPTDMLDEWDGSPQNEYRFGSENTIIEWTPEREESLVLLYRAIEQLIGKFRDVVNVPDKFLKLLDSGTAQLEDRRND